MKTKILILLIMMVPFLAPAQNASLQKDTLSVSQHLSQVTIYPNPATNYFIIQNTYSDSLIMTIFNNMGQKIDSKTIFKKWNSYSIEFLPSGLYIVRFTLKKKSKSMKLIKIK